MTVGTTIFLSLTMAAIAIVNASLMAWLWRFPMVPDPGGKRAEGVSTAPRWGVMLHRSLGYVFIACYLALLTEMLPRLWEFRTVSWIGVIHGLLGLSIGLLLTIKIAIIRRFHSAGRFLPWIGGTLAVVTLVTVGFGALPAWYVTRRVAPVTDVQREGRAAVERKCTQCHGASTIAEEREELRKWRRLIAEMQERSDEPGRERITDAEAAGAARYLAFSLGEDEQDDAGEAEDGEGERDERNDRRRGRGRGRGR